MKKLVSLFVAIILIFTFVSFSGCKDVSATSKDDSAQSDSGKDSNKVKVELNDSDEAVDTYDGEYPFATIVVKDYGKIIVELYPDKAPNTVNNFISLVDNGFYNGLTFHRIIEKFMIQGGCPEGTGMGDPGYAIKGEFAYNGFNGNDIAHERGVISMARGAYSMDSAGSQFFIMHETSPHLDGQYAAFGKVVEGMDVVDAIAVVSTDSNDKPLTPVVIESITVNANGYDWEEPVTLKK